MRKIRVAFIADMLVENLDGAIRTMYHLIHRIPKDQFEFLFLCGTPPKEDIGFEIVALPTTPLPINLSYNMAIPFLAEGKMKRSLQHFQPDILHISTPSPLGHYALNYGHAKGIPVLSIYHTHFLTYVDYYLRKVPMMIPPIKQKIIQYTQAFYNRCQLTLVPTPSIINELAAYGVKKNKMLLWQRGIDKKLFHPSKKNPWRMRQMLGNDRPRLLFASRLVWEKNLETLIRIYREAAAQQLDYNFIIVGDGVAKAALEEAMPKAHFLGHIEHQELAQLYASADVFLFPSDTESYGNVVIEAMASGLPCVI
ncbi:MAG: glycosyltransferase family 1 protein, partial [Bacteroidota bacterium]